MLTRFKCPVCGREVTTVYANIDHDADVLGCDHCISPELFNEDTVELDAEDLELVEEEDEEDNEPWQIYARYEGEE